MPPARFITLLALSCTLAATACRQRIAVQGGDRPGVVTQDEPATPPATAPAAPDTASLDPSTAVRGGSGPWPAGARTIESNDGTFHLTYKLSPTGVPPMNEPFEIEVAAVAFGADGAGEAQLAVDAGMPEHGHGMNVEPTVKTLGGNRFRVENMVFHMSGRWELYFDVTRDGITSRAQDEITLE
jgi:hypothetical protein